MPQTPKAAPSRRRRLPVGCDGCIGQVEVDPRRAEKLDHLLLTESAFLPAIAPGADCDARSAQRRDHGTPVAVRLADECHIEPGWAQGGAVEMVIAAPLGLDDP